MITNRYITFFAILILIGIIYGILQYTLFYVNNSNQSNKISMLSVYQYTEIVVGTLMFFIVYILYMSIIYRNVHKTDLIYSTISVGLILTFGNMISNWVEYNND